MAIDRFQAFMQCGTEKAEPKPENVAPQVTKRFANLLYDFRL